MYKNILIPLAYQPGHVPDVEIKAARAIAAPGAKITLLHVIGPIPEFRTEQAASTSALAQVVSHDLERVAESFVQAEVKVLEGTRQNRSLIWRAASTWIALCWPRTAPTLAHTDRPPVRWCAWHPARFIWFGRRLLSCITKGQRLSHARGAFLRF